MATDPVGADIEPRVVCGCTQADPREHPVARSINTLHPAAGGHQHRDGRRVPELDVDRDYDAYPVEGAVTVDIRSAGISSHPATPAHGSEIPEGTTLVPALDPGLVAGSDPQPLVAMARNIPAATAMPYRCVMPSPQSRFW